MWYIYTQRNVFRHKEEWNCIVCRYMNGTADDQIKQSKPSSGRQREHVFFHMRKVYLMVKTIHKYKHAVHIIYTYICIWIMCL
jgi:hypothetical protein